MSTTQERVIAQVSIWSGVKDVQLHQQFEELRMDSLDKVETAMAIEEEFSCILEDEDLEKCHTVSDLVALVQRVTGEVPA
jgi:acyl carrier protein